MNQHAVKFRPYSKLRGRMTEYGYTQETLADKIGLSQPAFGLRLTYKASWRLSEIYQLMDILGIPITEVETYFPKKEVMRSKKNIVQSKKLDA